MGRSTSAEAERAFRERVEAAGGQVIEPTWLGFHKRHRIICAEGHEWAVRPAAVSQGVGICRICAGNDPRTAELKFRQLVADRGGSVLEPAWLGARRQHRVRCAAGHEGRVVPNIAQRSPGICSVCSGCSSEWAERKFRERIAELGGVLVEPVWLGSHEPHRAICPIGHACKPRPSSLRKGDGMCRACAGCDPEWAERKFRERVAELGGIVLETRWLGNNKPHLIQCGEGHYTAPMPASVQQGNGICRFCKGMHWDVFYVVTDPQRHWLKFGITSQDGRVRLQAHARNGFTVVNLLLLNLPGTVAPDLEAAVKAVLKLADETPLRGCEYFDSSVLGLVMDVAETSRVSSLHDFAAGSGGIVGYARPGRA